LTLPFIAQAGPAVTWIKVDKPTFDLVGLVLSSLKLTGLLLFVASGLGVILGLSLILRRRARSPHTSLDAVSLHLDARPSAR
jgi:hypothetical protein